MNFFLLAIFFAVVASWEMTTEMWMWPGAMPDQEDESTEERKVVRGSQLLYSNKATNRHLAATICSELSAELVSVNIPSLAHFVVYNLGSSRMAWDTVWTSAIFRTNEAGAKVWSWYISQEKRYEDLINSLKKFFVQELPVPDVDNLRTCLAIGRDNHSKPSFRPLSCTALRPFICQREWDYITSEATHPGWIKLGKRMYKIFNNKLTYEQSKVHCQLFSGKKKAVDLATIISVKAARILGRHMLIGRPSMETAWIGANWDEKQRNYMFFPENLVISPITNSTTNFPPWLKGHVRKRGACIMLDRHLSHNVAFVESPCSAKRGRICYMMLNQSAPVTEDMIFDKWGYRLVLKLASWNNSVEYCHRWTTDYGSRLVEITEKEQRFEVLYVMGEIRKEISHIWLGATYVNDKWVWYDTKEEVTKNILYKWVHNETYSHSIDGNFKCLNMDRENHIKGLFYGTDCDFRQYFICMFPKVGLEKLQKDETVITDEDY